MATRRDASPPKATTDDTVEVTVAAIGARGDGLAESDQGRLYIPFAAPGDRLRVRLGAARGDGRAARIVDVLAPGPDRTRPVCRHFGTCGGCALQHLAPDAIAAIKRDLVRHAFARRGLADAPVGETITVPPGSRRRIRVALRRGRNPVLGFNERAGRRLLDVRECPVTAPDLVALLTPLRALCAALDALGRAADLQLTRTETGIDLVIHPARRAEPDLRTREALAGFAAARDLCRVSWQIGEACEPIAARRPAIVHFAGTPVALPPGGFLQPSAEGEAAIVGLVTEALTAGAPSQVADFYAGCGALSLPIARIAAVQAFEGDAAMAAALRDASRDVPVAVERRDLMRSPMAVAVLNRFDAAVFDPPRAGARPLAEALAASHVATVVAVSCNPATLARDVRILVDGGYRLARVTPIDQFAWSAHVEAVAVLRR